MMKGLPASGKSTRAKEILEEGGNFVRVNKDLLREMLHFSKYTGKNQGIIINTEIEIVRAALGGDFNVVVDDTNLQDYNYTNWKAMADVCGAKFEVIDMTDVDPYECVERDMWREKRVGSHVIMNMALEHSLYVPKKGFIICDLDGTLCDITHRLEFVKGEGKKDWKSFFAGISKDELRLDTFKKLCSYKEEGYSIVFVSARPSDYRKETEDWLTEQLGELEYETLIMRQAGDRREDTEVKQGVLNKYFKDKSLIHKVLDDRPSVIRMWRENGLDVIDVGEGVDF